MGMGVGTRLYPLPGGDGDETKVWYPLGLGMEMGMIFFTGMGMRHRNLCPPRPAPLPSLVSTKFKHTIMPTLSQCTTIQPINV